MDENHEIAASLASQKRLLLRMMVKITAYYVVLAGVVAMAITFVPNFADQLPLGGVGEIASYGASGAYDLEEALLSADDEELEEIVSESTRARLLGTPAWLQGATTLLTAMISTLILMLPVSWVYRAIHKDTVYDHSIDVTTLVLPAVIAGIVTMVQHSLALAFSLAGIVAGVRFRRALTDTFDTLFILSSIGVGLAAGIKSIEIAVILTVFLNYAALGVCSFGDGLESQHAMREKMRRKIKKAAKAREQSASAGNVTTGR
jgi:hypothetical protein